MKVDIENLSPVERRLAIEVPWETVKDELDLAYKGLAKRAKVRGFRAGHVPRKVLEQYYKQAVEGEVTNRLVDELFRKAVQEGSLVPINSPVLTETPKIAQETPFRFVATVEVKPDVEVAQYKGIDVVRKIREVTPDEVAAELRSLQEKATVVEQVTERKIVEKGDLAVIDFFGYVDGETFKGGKGINYTVEVGSSHMIPGFEDNLVGLTFGEQRTFNLPFPKEEGPEEVRGRTVEWRVDLKEIKRKILPELDDEFAKDLGEYDTLEELRKKIAENLATRADARSRRQIRDRAVEKLVELNPLSVPPLMVERQLDFILQDAYRAAKESKDPKIAEAIEKIRGESRGRAEKQVAGMLLLEAVTRVEQIEATEADLDSRVQELSKEHRIPAKQLRSQLTQDGRLDALRYNIRQDKALDLVVQHANISEERVVGAEHDDHDHDDAHDHDHDHPHGHHDHDHDHDHDHA